MRLLELFCGTKSVSKAVGTQFNEVVSLDVMPGFEPTITADILTWDYRVFPPGHFHTIWASPPCTEFSCLNHSRPSKTPNLALADSIVKRTIEIIEYYRPERFFIENPQTGSLKDRPYMDGIPFVDMDYCQFSDWGYRKRTRFWTNANVPDRLCIPATCSNMIGGRHKKALGNGEYDEFWIRGTTKGARQAQRYAIPADLIRALFA